MHVAFAAERDDPSIQGRKQKFLITAYYSPLPNQSRYFRGNYEAEIRFNGNGTNGADGTPVYPGMLAAPPTYAFGTKVDIPGLGLGTVHDRGGRIQAYQNHDRLDVWMGHGEEGLARALQWGARVVEATVYENSPSVTDTLNYQQIPPALLSSLPAVNALFSRTLFLGSTGDEVRKLQKYLKKLGFFSGPETGNFGSVTEQAVIDFQITTEVLASPAQHGAGVVGPKTRSTLEKKLAGETGAALAVASATSDQVPQHQTLLFRVGMGTETKGSEVKRLQAILDGLGYFKSEYSENYGSQTVNAVFAFQKDHDIVVSESAPGAGYVGPRTYSKLLEVLSQRRDLYAAFEAKETSVMIVHDESKKEYLVEETILQEAEQLTLGDQNNMVKELQQKLISAGLLEEGLHTGFYGEKTKAAVVEFQKKQQLIANEQTPWAGVFGKKTEEKLLAML